MDGSAKRIAHCPVFQGLDESELGQIYELLEPQTCPAGENVLREGLSTQMLWIIVKGQCEVVKTTKGGEQQRLAVLEPCATFGEMSFYKAAPHSASVRALTEVELLFLTRTKYDHLISSGSPAAFRIALNVIELLAQRLRRMDEWTCELVEHPQLDAHKEEWQDFRAKLFAEWQF